MLVETIDKITLPVYCDCGSKVAQKLSLQGGSQQGNSTDDKVCDYTQRRCRKAILCDFNLFNNLM